MAQGKLADLETSLSQVIGGGQPPLAAPAGMPGAVEPPLAPPQPPAAPVPPATPPAPTRITVAPEKRAEFYRKYSDASLNDEQSVGMLLEEAANLARESILSEITTNPAVVDGLLQQVTHRNTQRARVAQQVNQTIQSVEGWWKSIVPDANPEDIWVYTPMAAREHPVPANATPEVARRAHAQQAYYCLKRYLAVRGPISNPANAAVNRSQQVVMPGGSGAPPAGTTGGDHVPTFQEQLLARRSGTTA